ncbi:MAG: DUF2169 domain-containing protein [Bacteroidia bacterium]
MEVLNHTPYSHLLFRTALEKSDKNAASIAVRVFYKLNGQNLKCTTEGDWPLSPKPWMSQYGEILSDSVYKRGGVDLLLFGSAIAPFGVPTKEMMVNFKIKNKIDHSVCVIGNRFWENSFLGLQISEAEPFLEMPLTLSNAYGGTDVWDELIVPYSNNPIGKGFIWEKKNAYGKALPNIEHSFNRIRKWNDRPSPVGMVPITMCEERIRSSVEFDNKGKMVKLDPKYFNSAFNEMIATSVEEGEIISITGVNYNSLFQFAVPETKIKVLIQMGDNSYERIPVIDQIGVEPKHNFVFITYRYSFNYTIRPLEKRCITIFEN